MANSKDDFKAPVWRDPLMTPAFAKELHDAASVYARRNASDPFAYGRIFLHMRRGIVSTSEVKSDAGPMTLAI